MKTTPRTFALLLASSLGAAACGPMPGYHSYREPAPRQDVREDDDLGPPRGPTGAEEIRIVDTGRRDTYYIIDPNRRLCFFNDRGAVARVDCASLPEARDLVEAAPAPEQPADADTMPAISPERAAPSDESPPPERAHAEESTAADMGEQPTADEKRRFTLAYVEIFCAAREGRDVKTSDVIEEEGLTETRYSQIEGWMAADERAWRALRTAAVTSCRAETETTPQPTTNEQEDPRPVAPEGSI